MTTIILTGASGGLGQFLAHNLCKDFDKEGMKSWVRQFQIKQSFTM